MVSPVKDQGVCESCYAFAFLGALESKLLLDGAGAFDFSENHAKECNWEAFNGYSLVANTGEAATEGTRR